jgi:hypothetical protein
MKWRRLKATIAALAIVGVTVAGWSYNEGRTGAQHRLVFQYLDTLGTGAGGKNAVSDYSSTADTFFISPDSGFAFRVWQLVLYVRDDTIPTPEVYGGMDTALTNGILVEQYKASVDSPILDLTDGIRIKRNDDFQQLTGVQRSYQAVTKDSSVTVTFDFVNTFGQAMRLSGTDGDELRVIVADDFTHLVEHRFFVRGYVERAVPQGTENQ